MKKRLITMSLILLVGGIGFTSCDNDKAKIPPPVENPDDEEDQTPPSLKGSNYYVLFMDDTSFDVIKDKVSFDYRPGKNENVSPTFGNWNSGGTTVSDVSGENFYEQSSTWPGISIKQDSGWSVVSWYLVEQAGKTYDFSGIDGSYTLHLAVKSANTVTHGFRFYGLASDNATVKQFGFSLGETPIEGENITKLTDAKYNNFTRDGEWQEVEIPVSELIALGWNYPTAISYKAGNETMLAIVTIGSLAANLEVDAVFFYKKAVN